MNKFAFTIALAAGLHVIANAQVIDFEDLNNNGSSYTLYGDHFTSDGFLFTDLGHPGDSQAFASWTAGLPQYYTGSVAPFLNYNNDLLTMTKVGGGTFSVSQIALADVFLHSNNSSVTFTDNNSNSETVTMTDGTHLLNYALNFNNITSLTWNSGSIESTQFDNIHVSAAPEPASMTLVGLGVLGLLRKRRRA